MVYEYTKPRGPIAAMYNSPGPCYNLPPLTGQPGHDARSSHTRQPAFQFGIKHGKLVDDCSPGPVHLPDRKVFRDGKDGTPHYSLYSRTQDMKQFSVPGPGAYQPECAGQMSYSRQPSFSFGARTNLRKSDQNPAPNSYSLDSMLSKTVRSGKTQAPKFVLTSRSKVGSFCEDLTKTPGPGTYSVTQPDTYRNKAPNYSMTSRNMLPGDSTQKPGPGAHSPEKVVFNKKAAPNYSFGIRHSQYEAPLIVDPDC